MTSALVLALALVTPSRAADVVDTAPFDALLQAHVRGARVDYAGLDARGAELDAVVASLATASLAGASRDAIMAFWVNAYNALTLDLVVDNLPLASIKDVPGGNPWKGRTWTVAGRAVTLDVVEHEILRPMGDPRVHAAINCASVGCPPLASRPFRAATLEAQLDAAVKAWVATNALTLDRSAGSVGLSSIFNWFSKDFERFATADVPGISGAAEAAVLFLAPHLPADDAAWLRAGGYSVSWNVYDWSLNGR